MTRMGIEFAKYLIIEYDPETILVVWFGQRYQNVMKSDKIQRPQKTLY